MMEDQRDRQRNSRESLDELYRLDPAELRYRLPPEENLRILQGGCRELFEANGIDVLWLSEIGNRSLREYAFDLRRDVINYVGDQRRLHFFWFNVGLLLVMLMLFASFLLTQFAVAVGPLWLLLYIALELMLAKHVWQGSSLQYLPYSSKVMDRLSDLLLASCMSSGTPEQEAADTLEKVLPRVGPQRQGNCLSSLEAYLNSAPAEFLSTAKQHMEQDDHLWSIRRQVPMLCKLAILRMLSGLSREEEIHAPKSRDAAASLFN